MKFELNRLANYSDDNILAEIKRVAAIVEKPALTKELFTKHSLVHSSTVEKRFGGWIPALQKAGLQRLAAGFMRVSQMSNEDIIAELRPVAEKVGSKNISNTHLKEFCTISVSTLVKRFGSWQKAVEAAGLIPMEYNKHGKRYSDDECFENLLRVWTYYGRPPMYKEMSSPPSTVGGKAYMLRFGYWNKALKAFVDKVNSDQNDSIDISQEGLQESAAEQTKLEPQTDVKERKARQSQIQISRKQEDRREISIGMRFNVFHRDHFRCVLCGSSPATVLGCNLHADHIMPWSKGGKTTYVNLRTLCATCNIGRGNRFSD